MVVNDGINFSLMMFLLFSRIIPVPMALENQMPYRLVKGADVDHRNLISLTGSPANSTNTNDTSLPVLPNNNLWPTSDQDYR